MELVPENWEDAFCDSSVEGVDDVTLEEEDVWERQWVAALIPHLEEIEEKRRVEKRNLTIVVPQCGTSYLSWHLFDSGYVSTLNLDRDTNIIRRMSRLSLLRYLSGASAMKWLESDIRIARNCHAVIDYEGRGFGLSNASDEDYFRAASMMLEGDACKLLLIFSSIHMLGFIHGIPK